MASNEEISKKYYDYAKENYDKLNQNPKAPSFKSQDSFYRALASRIEKEAEDKYDDLDSRQNAIDMIWKQLENTADTPEKNPIFSSDGKLNVTVLKSVMKVAEKEIALNDSRTNNAIDSEKADKSVENKIIDLNTPQQRQQYINEIFGEYNKLKTDEERKTYKENNFDGYGKDEIVTEIVDKTFERQEAIQKKMKKNPELTREEAVNAVYSDRNEIKEVVDLEAEIFCDFKQMNELRKLGKKDKKEYQDLKKSIDEKLVQKTELLKNDNLKIEMNNTTIEQNEDNFDEFGEDNLEAEDDGIQQKNDTVLPEVDEDFDMLPGLELDLSNEIEDSEERKESKGIVSQSEKNEQERLKLTLREGDIPIPEDARNGKSPLGVEIDYTQEKKKTLL